MENFDEDDIERVLDDKPLKYTNEQKLSLLNLLRIAKRLDERLKKIVERSQLNKTNHIIDDKE